MAEGSMAPAFFLRAKILGCRESRTPEVQFPGRLLLGDWVNKEAIVLLTFRLVLFFVTGS